MTQAKPPRPRSRLSGLSVWLSILGLALLFLPLLLLSRSIRAAETAAQETLVSLQTHLASEPDRPTELETLEQTQLEWTSQTNTLTGLRDELIAMHVNFPAVASTLLNYRPEIMMLTQVIQNTSSDTQGWLLVNGEAHYESQVIDYVDYLRQSGMFARVDVQSISLQSNTVPVTLRPGQATLDAGAPVMPHFERGLQWVTFSLRLTWAGNGS